MLLTQAVRRRAGFVALASGGLLCAVLPSAAAAPTSPTPRTSSTGGTYSLAVDSSVDSAVDRAAPAISTGRAAHASRPKKKQRHKIHLVLMKGPDGKDRTTIAELRAAVRQVDAFYQRSTGGRIRFTVGKTHGWVRGTRYCDVGVGGPLADRFGWKPRTYVHVVVYQAVVCPFAAAANQPGKLVVLGSEATSSALAHELGHNLGLGHANAARCSRALAKACSPRKDAKRAAEYADLTDVMGAEVTTADAPRFTAAIPGTLNPAMLRRLHVPVHATRIGPGSAGRTVLLRSRARGGYNTVELTWAGRTVWLSYQPPRPDDDTFVVPGWYAPATTPQLVMHAQAPDGTSLLIPRTSSSEDGAGLPVGGTYALPGGLRMQTELAGDAVRLLFSRS